MAQLDRTQLKAKFENGDIPTQADFADLIDSLALKSEISNSGTTLPDPNIVTYNITESGLLPYYCFNYGSKRGILGYTSATTKDNKNFINMHVDYYYGVNIDTIPGSISHNSLGIVNTNASINYISTSKKSYLNDTVSSNSNSLETIYSNNVHKTLYDFLPIAISAANAEFYIDLYNFQNGVYISAYNDSPKLKWTFDTDGSDIYHLQFLLDEDLEINYIDINFNWYYDENAGDWKNLACLFKNSAGSIVLEGGIDHIIYLPLPYDIYEHIESWTSDPGSYSYTPGLNFNIRGLYNGNEYDVLFEDDINSWSNKANAGSWIDDYYMDISSIILDNM